MKRLIRSIPIFCIPVLFALCLTISASAEDPIAGADFNDGAMHWSISADNVLTISGTGEMPNYSSSVNAPWYSYRSQITSVVVQNGVTGLGDYAFYGLSNVISVDVSDSVETLGESCFRGCSSLTEISLPDSVNTLGSYCFYECSSLPAIVIPDGIAHIPDSAFNNCSSLESVSLPDSVRTFGYGAFQSCRNLKSITIPDGVTKLTANYLFNGCNSLASIILPSTLIEIGGYYSFSSTGIANIYYGGTLSQWLGVTFNGYNNNSSYLPMRKSCNLYIQGEKLTNLTIPADVTSIPSYAFQYVNLSSVSFSYRVKEIGSYAFYGSSVSTVRMMDSVTTVGTNAFANCSQLNKVYFAGDQSKWSSIAWNTGNDALIDAERVFISSLDDDVYTVSVGELENGTVTVSDAYCVAGDVITITAQPDLGYRLEHILVNGEEITGNSFTAEANTDYVVTAEFTFYMTVRDHGTCGTNLTWYLYENNELVISGSGEMANYDTPPWYDYRNDILSVSIGEGVTTLGGRAFYYCSSLQKITIPDSVTTIGRDTFCGCTSLSEIDLPAGLTQIYSSFYNCPLQSVHYAGNIADWLQIEFTTYYGEGYFPQNRTENLYIDGELVQDLVIPDGVTEILDYAFYEYKGLQSVVMPDSLRTIGNSAFQRCAGLRTVDLSSGVETIDQYAFYGCSSLDNITLSDTLQSIGQEVFSRCGLIYAEFLGNAPEIDSYAFSSNDSNFVIYYHTGTTGWTSPKWNGYTAALVEAASDYGSLDDDNRNAQGILFTLNATAKTATVGSGSGYNNAGYYGAQKGAVVIPDTVTKGGEIYRVIAIGPNAFSHNKNVRSVSIGSGVSSIIPSAFSGCPSLASITVSSDNEYYSASDGVLYDVGKLYLYVYPGGKSDEAFTVPNTVKTIGQYAFYDNEFLRNLTVGRSVTAIYSNAFCGLSNLSEVTLPFVGTKTMAQPYAHDDWVSYGDTPELGAVFGSGYYGKHCLSSNNYYYNNAGGSLKKVTITGGYLPVAAFSNCTSVEEIVLKTIPNIITPGCFSGCSSLQKITFGNHTCEVGELILPEGITSIESNAFSGCKAITSVTLPASLTSIDSSAFSNAGVEQFSVAAKNKNYSADSWGVLYNLDKTTLVQYPSCRKWPYYNVSDKTNTINYQAFSGCSNLVNLYVPNSVTSMNNNAIYNCPNLTLCCYMNSTAYHYALNKGLTAWYMDNKTLQGISIYSLPEQTVQFQNSLNLQGLYVVGNYQGKELQIDDYTISYDKTTPGVKTITVEYQGKTVTFEMTLCTSAEGNIISFRSNEDLDGKVVLISVYGSDGEMLYGGTATVSGKDVHIIVDDKVYKNADYAKLFILDSGTLTPNVEVQEQDL